MISVKILGTGCKKCTNLEQIVRDMVKDNNIDAEVEKVTDFTEIMKYGILATPGLVINEKVVSFGVIPSKDKILTWLNEGGK
ncbi:MAG TPA: thioredoxin family protein [Melioribacteraceae bacterium]|nr:thioredoxin family protein [Melioribacteraceae bacterium]